MKKFTFSPTKKPEHLRMLKAIECAVGDAPASYISGPITTGPIFIKWYKTVGCRLLENPAAYNAAMREDVISKNEKAILEIAVSTRERDCVPVIEPASLYISDWTQEDYIEFWIQVLNRFVHRIVLTKGWEYSVGCATEFSFAISKKCLILSDEGNEISHKVGIGMIEKAAKEVDAIALNDEILSGLAARLRAAVMECKL